MSIRHWYKVVFKLTKSLWDHSSNFSDKVDGPSFNYNSIFQILLSLDLPVSKWSIKWICGIKWILWFKNELQIICNNVITKYFDISKFVILKDWVMNKGEMDSQPNCSNFKDSPLNTKSFAEIVNLNKVSLFLFFCINNSL